MEITDIDTSAKSTIGSNNNGIFFFFSNSTNRFTDFNICATINKKDLSAPMDEKEDYYMTLERFQKDGAILRYCGISPVTTYWKGAGGMNATRTNESELNGANLMKQLYPELVDCVYRKKGGRWDLKLVRQSAQLLHESSLFSELTNLLESDHLHPASATSDSSQT